MVLGALGCMNNADFGKKKLMKTLFCFKAILQSVQQSAANDVEGVEYRRLKHV